ncbi:MAG: 50S ribosomal protein L30 [Candidatus Hydrothermarchaeaceae archaeon]
MKRLAVIRIKGKWGVDRRVEDTLRMLNLTRVNHCTLINDDRVNSGMLEKVKDHVTWGEIDVEALRLLLSHRGELAGHQKLTDSYVKKRTKYSSIAGFSKAFVNFEAELEDIPGLRPFFRLHPPRRGHEGIKRTFRQGGALGRRDDVKSLLYKMR